MSIEIKNAKTFKEEARSFETAWHYPEDDARGWLALAVENGHLEQALSALADPMEFGRTGDLTDADSAKLRLRGVLWVLTQLSDRADRLTVALRDQFGLSWSDLAAVIDPEDPKRSTARRRYDSGRSRVENVNADMPRDEVELQERINAEWNADADQEQE
jgi:hypothetical protein